MTLAESNRRRWLVHEPALRAASGIKSQLWALCVLGLAGAGVAVPCVAADSLAGLEAAFRPPGAVEARPDAPTEKLPDSDVSGLRVLVSSRSRSLAFIDGHLVHVGDKVNGMRVTEINQRGVVLAGDGRARQRLDINPTVVKRTHPLKETRHSKESAQ